MTQPMLKMILDVGDKSLNPRDVCCVLGSVGIVSEKTTTQFVIFDKTHTWRIIPVSKWLVTPIYKPFRPFIKGITPFRGLTITMVINHLRVLG